MPHAAPTNPEAPSPAVYCAGCNERFNMWGDAGVCPRCGSAVAYAPMPGLAETMMLKDSVLGEGGSPAACAELDLLVGTELHCYECESLIGRGAMGRVYLARHKDLHRRCALKILSPKTASRDQDYVERFLHEGRAAAHLVHPNIVTVHAIGQARDHYFLEMEFVPGPSLQHLIENEGPMTPIRATVLAAQIADGLAAAHRAGIIHRDLKPDNVLLTHQGTCKIADFGLAKRVLTPSQTTREPLVGTPHFMAPELYLREPANERSDVYALGICYFFMLTGRLPYSGTTLEELSDAIAYEPLPSVRNGQTKIPLEMAECLNMLAAKSPANRPRDAAEAAQLLRAVAGQERDVESLLHEAFADVPGVTWKRAGNAYRLQLSLPDGRGQAVIVEPSGHTAGERLLLIYSLCCRAEPAYYEEALRLNAEILHGGVALRDYEGVSHFVVMDTYPRGTVDPEEIRRSALEIGSRADAVEALLTGLDRY